MKNLKFNLLSQHGNFYGTRVVSLLLFFITFLASLNCSASLLITPSRVVFEDRTRTEQVTLNNKGSETTTYRISFIRQNMTVDGNFEAVEEGQEGLYSDEIVRYSPRQVMLAPGQTQVVRLMLRKPKSLADGEYRSHMLLQALPKVTTTDISKAVDENSDEISVEITTILGVSIPVIVRHGKLESELTLTNASFVASPASKKKPYIAVDMNRSGNESTYGDFRVTHVSESGQSTIVSNAKGIAVYSPNQIRKFHIPVDIIDGVDYKKGRFHITYVESGKDESTGLISAIDLEL